MRVALGVSGGIAAYKACEIVRGLTRAGCDVQVLMTRNATEFITPLTLQTLSGNRVLVGQFELDTDETIRHIELTRRIDAFVVAPATANTLAKFARGVADDLLSTFFTSVTAPIVLAPAMNTRMWRHPETRANVEHLSARGIRIVDPGEGWLAEREIGEGRLAEPAEIVEQTLIAARRSKLLDGRKVVISAGPTREPIDPVRYLSNRSSGKMGFALAEAAARRGARVVLVAGPVTCPTPFGVERVDVTTASEMHRAMLEARDGADTVIMCAAVADYIPRFSEQKIKKTAGTLEWTLDRGVDILAELGAARAERLLVGFAAETRDLIENAASKLQKKNLDYIVANDVSGHNTGMDAQDNAVTVLGRDGSSLAIERASKTVVAERLLDHLYADLTEPQG
jgi:phosphopantothenoylcysteine decarboxylase/phosphopantothenate--cysteine ligase